MRVGEMFNEKLNIQPVTKGRLTKLDIEQLSELYGEILNEAAKTMGNPVYLFTREILQSDELLFRVMDYFPNENDDNVVTDKGTYSVDETEMVAIKDNLDGNYTLYMLGSFGYNVNDNGIDFDYLDEQLDNGKLENDIYDALKTVNTNIFYGRMWNPADLSDGDFIHIPMKMVFPGGIFSGKKDLIRREVMQTLNASFKALEKKLQGYLAKNNPMGTK